MTTLSLKDKLPLLKQGILLTDNTLSFEPLESILTVNQHPIKLKSKTFIHKHSPARDTQTTSLPNKSTHFEGPVTPPLPHNSLESMDFGFGPFYVPPYHPSKIPATQLIPEADQSIHPQNKDPVHDPKPKCLEYNHEPVSGTRWLLTNLPYSPPERLPDIYQYPAVFSAYTPGRKMWATGTSCEPLPPTTTATTTSGTATTHTRATPTSPSKRGLPKLRTESLQTEIYPRLPTSLTDAKPRRPDTTTIPSLIAKYKPATAYTLLKKPQDPLTWTRATPASPSSTTTSRTGITASTGVPNTPPQQKDLPPRPPIHFPETSTSSYHHRITKSTETSSVNIKVVAGKTCYTFPVLSPSCGRPVLRADGSGRVEVGFVGRNGVDGWGWEVKCALGRAEYLYGL
ncbi:hypothetical protein HDU79_004644 [Rhizoclosmatium sp. JEL0117]|nr:hypothetical protein HDU79_004644 [Rhizoclosmatium sp. JEL0117]